MNAPLRWTLALAAIGTVGFAAGRYLGSAGAPPPHDLSFPVVAPTGPASAAPSATATAGPGKVPGTLREILKLRGDFTQSAALYVLAANSDRKGIERLLEEAETIDRASERRAAASILYERYAELDPEAAIEHMLRHETGLDQNALYAVFYSWGRSDLEGALARAAKLDDRSRTTAGTAIVRSRDDLPTADREALGSKLDLHIAVRDPSTTDLRSPEAAQRSWQSALAIRDREARQRQLFTVTHEWVRQDPDAAIRAIESLQDRSQRELLLRVALQSWGQKDPRAAVQWVLARPPSHQRTELLGESLSAFAAKEPTAAMAMMERLSPVERQRMMPQVLMNWASTDPQGAAAWLERQDDTKLHQSALMTIANIYTERDPDEALRWAASLSGESAQIVMGQVIQRIAYDDPERASSLVRQMNEGPERAGTIAAIAQVWAQQEPRAALSWAEKQSSADVGPELYRSVFSQWAVYETDSAVSQLNFILDSEGRNAAIFGILDASYLDFDLIERLLLRLEGADARRQAAQQLYFLLRESDPQAAERYRTAAGVIEGNEGPIIVN